MSSSAARSAMSELRTEGALPSSAAAARRGPAGRVETIGVEGSEVALGASRAVVWLPLLVRAAAVALALVGLAAIGAAARRSPELVGLVPARNSVELAALSGGALAPAVPPALGPSPPAAPRGLQAAPGRAPDAGFCACPCSATAAQGREGRAPTSATALPSELGAALASGPRGRHVEALNQAAPASAPKVDLNAADARQLKSLPGIGTKRAAAILQLRQRLGGFRRPSDLLRIRGIGRRILQRLLPHVVVGAPGGQPHPPAARRSNPPPADSVQSPPTAGATINASGSRQRAASH